MHLDYENLEHVAKSIPIEVIKKPIKLPTFQEFNNLMKKMRNYFTKELKIVSLFIRSFDCSLFEGT